MHKIKESLTKQLLIIVAVIVAISQIGIISVIADVNEPTSDVLITSEKTNVGIDEVFKVNVKGDEVDLTDFKISYPKSLILVSEKNINKKHIEYQFKASTEGEFTVNGLLKDKELEGVTIKVKNEKEAEKAKEADATPKASLNKSVVAEKDPIDKGTKNATLEYDVNLSAQKDVDFSSGENYLGFPYKVTINSTANATNTLAGVNLTFKIPSGYKLSSDGENSGIVTGPDSIVKEYTINDDGTINIVLNEITKTIAEFTIAIVPITDAGSEANIHDRYDGEILTGSIVGSETVSGKVPQSEQQTTLHGTTDYAVNKTAATAPGSTNRLVTYSFNVNRVGSNKEITLQNLKLEDNIPAGAIIKSSNNAGGKWIITGDQNTGWKAIWERDKQFYGAGNSLSSQDGEIPSLVVEYPEDKFPDDTRPPKNIVTMSANDNNPESTEIAGKPSEAQGPILSSGEDDSSGLDKKILTNTWLSGSIYSNYEVNGSFVADKNSKKSVKNMTIEDSMDRFGNEVFWSHFIISNINIQLNTPIVEGDTKLTVSYKTNKNGWRNASDAKAKSVLKIGFHVVGSLNYAQTDKSDLQIDLQPGEVLTGWKVSVVNEKDKAENVQPKIIVNGISSFANIFDQTIDHSIKSIQNTASQEVEFKDGSISEEKTSEAKVNLQPNLNLNTIVNVPSTLTVGKTNNFTVYANNLTPEEDVDGAIMRVVLPAGVTLDSSKGVSAAEKKLGAPYNIDVPQPGNDIDITTEVLPATADYNASRQVVVFKFKKALATLQKAGSASDRNIGNSGFKYNLPVNVSQVAYDAFIENNQKAPIESWITTDSEKFKDYSVVAYGSRNHQDIHDFDKNRDSIVWDSKFSQVISDGGLILSKSVEGAVNTGFSDQATTSNGENATWKLLLNNTLSTQVVSPVIFDDISKLNGNSDFITKLTGPIEVSKGAVVEYSKDATSSNNGSWSSDWKEAKSFKITKNVLNIGEKIEAFVPVTSPISAKQGELTINTAQGEAILNGNTLPFTSNEAQINIVVDTNTVVLSKTDDTTKEKLQGAVFDLQDSNGKVLQSGLTTDDEGKITVDELVVGTYQFVETKAPTGYELDATPIKFEVKKGQTEVVQVSMTNELTKGGFVLTKTDDKTGEALQGAVFELQDTDGKVLQSGLTTDASGKIAVSDLTPGNYQLVETKAPTGYELDSTPIKVEVKKGQTEAVQVSMTNELTKGGFVLTKTDDKTGEALQGAVFELQDTDGKVLQSGLTTDASGKIAVSD